jgi:hypothetical protein
MNGASAHIRQFALVVVGTGEARAGDRDRPSWSDSPDECRQRAIDKRSDRKSPPLKSTGLSKWHDRNSSAAGRRDVRAATAAGSR